MNNALPTATAAFLEIRSPAIEDGSTLHQLAQASQGLDVNAEYAYLLPGLHHADSSAIATLRGVPAGFVSGYRLPRDIHRPDDTLFIWQVAVHPGFRGQRVARYMLHALLARPQNASLRFIETTITPSNTVSTKLFAALARDLNTKMQPIATLGTHLFTRSHEAETLYRIGPFDPNHLPSEHT